MKKKIPLNCSYEPNGYINLINKFRIIFLKNTITGQIFGYGMIVIGSSNALNPDGT